MQNLRSSEQAVPQEPLLRQKGNSKMRNDAGGREEALRKAVWAASRRRISAAIVLLITLYSLK